MERIEYQNPNSQELAKQILGWITCAKRPLMTTELQHAMAVEFGSSKMDEENLTEITDMTSVCAGLVTVDEKSGIIRLVHYTTQQYFERTWTSWFPDIQRDITTTCVTYLSFDAFKSGFCQTDDEFEARLRSNVFYDYAARNWGYHARSVFLDVEHLVLDFLESEAQLSASSQAMTISDRFSGYSQDVPKRMTGVHVAAHFGLKEAMAALLNNGHDLNLRDTYGRTPLLISAAEGHEAVVSLLLVESNVHLNPKDKYNGRTPLFWAVVNRHEGVVKVLLARDGVNPNYKNIDGQTPLSWAANEGCEAVTKLLLGKDGVHLNSKDRYTGRTPLSRAVVNGDEVVTKLLLAMDGVNPNSMDINGHTPLSLAAVKGHEVIVKLLLDEKSVYLNPKDNYRGLTPLLWATEAGHSKIMQLLLEKGADCTNRGTLLSFAAKNGYDVVVKLLLENYYYYYLLYSDWPRGHSVHLCAFFL
jgi:ankyrin repeat protein